MSSLPSHVYVLIEEYTERIQKSTVLAVFTDKNEALRMLKLRQRTISDLAFVRIFVQTAVVNPSDKSQPVIYAVSSL